MAPQLDLPSRSKPTHLCERNDQYTILTPPQLNFPTRFCERNDQSANSSSFSSEYSAPYHNV